MSPRRPGRWDLSDLGEAAVRFRRWPPPTTPLLADEPSIPFGPPAEGSRELLRCTRCGAAEPLGASALAELARGLARDHGFELEAHALVISGVCGRCRAGRRRRPPAVAEGAAPAPPVKAPRGGG